MTLASNNQVTLKSRALYCMKLRTSQKGTFLSLETWTNVDWFGGCGLNPCLPRKGFLLSLWFCWLTSLSL